MANTLVQFREDESVREKAAGICERLGIDIPTYLRMCLRRLNQENGVPFDMKLHDDISVRGFAALTRAWEISEENGNTDMTLDEINSEIAAARG